MKYTDWFIVLFFAILGFLLRISNLNAPDEVFFDETYYINAAKTYLGSNLDPNYVHPPLAKILMGLGIKIFGDSPFGWRIASAIFGSLIILIILLLTWQFFKNKFALTATGILASLEFLHFVQSRIAMLDIFLAFFIILAFYLFYLYLENPEKFKLYPLYASLILGCATSCKWSGIFATIGIFVIYFFYKKFNIKNQYIKPLKFALLLSSCIFFIYVLVYIPFFAKGGTFLTFYKNHMRILHFHYAEKFTHGYLSSIWSWPLMIRPIWYYYKETSDAACRGIVAMGNPFFWWSFLVFFVYCIFNFIKTKNEVLFFIIIGYLSNYLFWFISLKGGFFYYMLTSTSFMILAVTFVLNKWWKEDKKILAVLYLLTIMVSFASFYPILNNMPIPKNYFYKLMWLKSWI